MPMRNGKTACFEALVLEAHFAQILRLLLATLLPVRSLQGLQGCCARVGQKPALLLAPVMLRQESEKITGEAPAFGVHFHKSITSLKLALSK